MSELVELHGHPPLSSPVMILALEGWIDAGMAANGAMTAIIEGIDTEPLASFDTDVLLDHRARRPMMSLVEGHVVDVDGAEVDAGVMDELVVGERGHGFTSRCRSRTVIEEGGRASVLRLPSATSTAAGVKPSGPPA